MDRIESSAVLAAQGPQSEITCSACGRLMPEVTCEACDGSGRILEFRREYVKTPILRLGRYLAHVIQRDCALCDGTGLRKGDAR